MVTSASPSIQTDTWLKATWGTFIEVTETPEAQDGRGYFDHGYMRLEIAPLGAGHGRQNSVVMDVVSLFATFNKIRIAKFINCSFSRTDVLGCQPDAAFYIGEDFQLPPQDSSPIDVDVFGPPTLAIEVGATSFRDDLGAKRLLYERLGVSEYWVINVLKKQAIAFEVSEGRSGQVQESIVLPGLSMALIEEALQRSQTEDDSSLLRWLMDTLS